MFFYLFMDKKDTFIKAINKNIGLIFKVSSIYTHNNEDRNDLSQEIIYQLWKSFDSFQQKSSLSTWMYRVAMNVAIHNLKMTNRKVSTIPLDEQFINFQDIDNSEIEKKWELLRRHIESLNLLDKGIIILYLDNKSHEEIAHIIGISKSNVGTKLSRIKEKLKKQILNS